MDVIIQFGEDVRIPHRVFVPLWKAQKGQSDTTFIAVKRMVVTLKRRSLFLELVRNCVSIHGRQCM